MSYTQSYLSVQQDKISFASYDDTDPATQATRQQQYHDHMKKAYYNLDHCGVYYFLRLAENSYNLVEIDGPEGGVSVTYLRDILNQAKLFLQPLQRDVTSEDAEIFSEQNKVR